MTTKKPSRELDAMSCILHAAEQGIPFDKYVDGVREYGKKRIKMIAKGWED